MDAKNIFQNAFENAIRLTEQFKNDSTQQDALVSLANDILDCYQNGGKVLIAGNGGSMADAMHFAEEWTGRFRKERRPFPAMALADPTHLTCVANDYGFDFVFSRMVQAFGKPTDILILLSTSGNSNNLITAATEAKAIGMKVVGFLGRDGGRLKPECDLVIMAPGTSSDRIQEIHMMSLHILIEVVEVMLGVA